jgi:hypothetical protein
MKSPLEYRPQKAIFTFVHRYRSVKTFYGMLIALFFAFGMGYISVVIDDMRGRIIFGSAAVACGIFLGTLLWLFALNKIVTVEIAEDGIIREGRILFWTQIHAIHGEQNADGIALAVSDANGVRLLTIEPTPPLDRKMFDGIIRTIVNDVLPFNKHICVVKEPIIISPPSISTP